MHENKQIEDIELLNSTVDPECLKIPREGLQG